MAMRTTTVMKLVAFGVGAGAVLGYRRARRARRGSSARYYDDLARDPGDPVQGFDEVVELAVEPLEVDALSNEDLAAAQDLAGLIAELDREAEAGGDDEVDNDAYGAESQPARPTDSGELYGAHTPIAVDRDHPDDDRAVADGQNWLEALETSAVENGAEPERPLDDIVDDEELLRAPHHTARGDRPIADLGSGGRRGL
jgi:hypothetical protein